MSWGAQNRSKDAKTPSVGPAMSGKPELDRCPVTIETDGLTEETDGLTDGHMAGLYFQLFF